MIQHLQDGETIAHKSLKNIWSAVSLDNLEWSYCSCGSALAMFLTTLFWNWRVLFYVQNLLSCSFLFAYFLFISTWHQILVHQLISLSLWLSNCQNTLYTMFMCFSRLVIFWFPARGPIVILIDNLILQYIVLFTVSCFNNTEIAFSEILRSFFWCCACCSVPLHAGDIRFICWIINLP